MYRPRVKKALKIYGEVKIMSQKTTFALYFGNRGFFPGEVIAAARCELCKAVETAGFGYIIMDETLTRYGAVETIDEGKLYAQFLKEHEGQFQGIIVCLPNFGDENGAYYALKDAGVPILVQAYPDELGKMDFAHRRDSVCGKIAMCNVFRQAGIKYTLTRKFAVHPMDESFRQDLVQFAGTCRAVHGMKCFTVGAIGARTTAFKTVRIDEIAFQRKGINVETVDLAQVFALMDAAEGPELEQKKEHYRNFSNFGSYPEIKLENIARLAVAIDKLIASLSLDAIAIRCWDELQKRYGIAPCVILSDLNGRGIMCACELDVNNAVMMRALNLAADYPVMLLDVNNNYGEDENRAIFFHCGPAPEALLAEKGHIEEHLMFKKTYGDQSGVGLNVAKIAPNDITLGSMKTEDGKIWAFAAEGAIVDEELEEAFFGCGAVFQKTTGTANDLLNYMSTEGYRHHVAITKGHWCKAVKDAFGYLELNLDIV